MIRINNEREFPQAPLSGEELAAAALERIEQGFAPPREIYSIANRRVIDWSKFPLWARPLDPEVFDGCCHEG